MDEHSTTWHIRGDLHVHASHSACDRHKVGDPVGYDTYCGAQSIEEMRAHLKSHQYDYLAIVNHATDPVDPQPPNDESELKINDHVIAVRAVNELRQDGDPILLSGAEASLLPGGGIDISDTTAQTVDVLIASRHGNTTNWSTQQTLGHLTTLFRSIPIHILGHPTRYTPMESVEAYRELLALCQRSHIAFELNLRNPFGPDLAKAVIESGVYVSLGSDIHGELIRSGPLRSASTRTIPMLYELMAAGLTEDRVLNTWPFESLSEFLAERQRMCDTTAR